MFALAKLRSVLADWVDSLDLTQSHKLDLYEEFKNISLAFNLAVFLGVQRKDDEQLFQSFKVGNVKILSDSLIVRKQRFRNRLSYSSSAPHLIREYI